MPASKYKMKTKRKKGHPLSSDQKKALEQGTFEIKVERTLIKCKKWREE